MIEGVRILMDGITDEGETLDPQRVLLAVERGGDAHEPVVEVTLADGSTWSADFDVIERALMFAKAEFRKSRAQ